jgi:hypothetical protein
VSLAEHVARVEREHATMRERLSRHDELLLELARRMYRRGYSAGYRASRRGAPAVADPERLSRRSTRQLLVNGNLAPALSEARAAVEARR